MFCDWWHRDGCFFTADNQKYDYAYKIYAQRRTILAKKCMLTLDCEPLSMLKGVSSSKVWRRHDARPVNLLNNTMHTLCG